MAGADSQWSPMETVPSSLTRRNTDIDDPGEPEQVLATVHTDNMTAHIVDDGVGNTSLPNLSLDAVLSYCDGQLVLNPHNLLIDTCGSPVSLSMLIDQCNTSTSRRMRNLTLQVYLLAAINLGLLVYGIKKTPPR